MIETQLEIFTPADTVCIICGHSIEGTGKQKKGRPRQYHDNCRHLLNAFNLLQDRLLKFLDCNPLPENKNLIRQQMWHVANYLNQKSKKKE